MKVYFWLPYFLILFIIKPRIYFRIFVLFQEYCHEATVEVKWYWIWWWLLVMLLSSFHTNNSSIFSIQLYRDDSNSSGFVGYKHCVHSSKLEMRVTCGKMWGFILFHTYYTNVHIKEFWERILTYTRAHNLSIVLFACPALPANSIADMQAMIDNAHRRDLQALSSCRRCQLSFTQI